MPPQLFELSTPAPATQPTQYDDRFFDGLNVNSAQSASKIVPLLLGLIGPRSVIDVGCGEGAWLSAFVDEGIEDYLGIDGDYVNRERLKIPAERFRAIDLQRTFELDRTFDLAVCLEVAEHLVPESAENFVAHLVQCAPVICFSAAIPGQGGTDHRNEKWPGYWADLFEKHDYHCYDALRPRLWQSPEVSFWYAQNALLFVRADHASRYPELAATRTTHPDALIHPALWTRLHKRFTDAEYHMAHPGLKVSSKAVLRAAGDWVRKRVAGTATSPTSK